MKKTITEKLHLYIDIDTLLAGTLTEVCNNVKDIETRLKAEHQALILDPSKYKDFKIAYERDYHSYEPDPRIRVWGIREETDQEYKHRFQKEKITKETAERKAIEKAQRLKEKKKEAKIREKELYLELKKKYDKKGI